MPIKRFFSDDNFKRVKKDFQFLSKFIQNSYGEYDLSIRENYFNLYYKGYSIGKIEPQRDNAYRVSIHTNFFSGSKADNPIYFKSKKYSGQYCVLQLDTKNLHPFFQIKHLAEFAANVKKEPSGEIGFEQSILTDNLNRNSIIIIDRQITDTELKGKRLDLLTLRRVNGNKYKFQLLEVKLGNNNELKDEVAAQLEGYVNHIKAHFLEYKECYEKHYIQKKELGLFKKPTYKKIEIIEPVEGLIIVGGYSGMAHPRIKTLKAAYPNLEIKHFTNAL
jgi:hypothetical protein